MLSVNMSIIYSIINLIILFLIFRFILFKRVDKILRTREDETRAVKEKAAADMAEAKEIKEKYEAAYAKLEAEKEEVFAETKRIAYGVRERILREAKEQADELIETARQNAEDTAAKERAKNDDAITELVMNAASKISAGAHADDADKKLYSMFIHAAIEQVESEGEDAYESAKRD